MPWPCCCGGEDVNCNNFKNENCCINPYDNYEYVILICNSNAAKDDEFNVVLNGTLLGPVTELGLNQCGGRFFATSESAISKVKSLASTCNNSFNDCCMQNTFNFTLFNKNLIQIGSNKISMYNTKNNFNGNQGRIIVFRVMNDKKVTAVHNGQYGGPSGADIINAAMFDQLNCNLLFNNRFAGTQLYPNPLGYYNVSRVRSIIEPIGEMVDLSTLPNIIQGTVLGNPFKETLVLDPYTLNVFVWNPFYTLDYAADFNKYWYTNNETILSAMYQINSTAMFNFPDILTRNNLIIGVGALPGSGNYWARNWFSSSSYVNGAGVPYDSPPADIILSYDSENILTITLTSVLPLFYTYVTPNTDPFSGTPFGPTLEAQIGTIKVTNIYRGTPLSC